MLTLSQSSFAALLVGPRRARRDALEREEAVGARGACVVLVGVAFVLVAPGAIRLDLGSSKSAELGDERALRPHHGRRGAVRRPAARRAGARARSRASTAAHEHVSAERATSASHTIPITVAAEQGVLGLAAYLALLVVRAVAAVPRRAPSAPARAGVAAAFAALLVHTMMYAAFLEDPLTWALLGVGTGARARRPRAAAPAEPRPRRRARRSRRAGVARLRRAAADAAARARAARRRSSPPRVVVVGARPDLSRTTTPTTTWSGAASCSTGTSRRSRPTRRRPSTRCSSLLVRACSALAGDGRRPAARARLRAVASSRSCGGRTGSGAAVFGRWPGVLGALFVGSSFAFLLYAARAYVDVPFLALVAVGGGARGRAPARAGARSWRCSRSPGCCARRRGCSRALYWLWCAGRRRRRGGCAGPARAGPRRAADLGARRPLASPATRCTRCTRRATLADELDRERGLGDVPGLVRVVLVDAARPPVALAALAGAVLAWRRRAGRRACTSRSRCFGAGVADVRRHRRRRARRSCRAT